MNLQNKKDSRLRKVVILQKCHIQIVIEHRPNIDDVYHSKNSRNDEWNFCPQTMIPLKYKVNEPNSKN